LEFLFPISNQYCSGVNPQRVSGKDLHESSNEEMSRKSGQRANVGRALNASKPYQRKLGELTRQKWNLSSHHVKYKIETLAMRLAIQLLEKQTSMTVTQNV
jgi:hypothetical protein